MKPKMFKYFSNLTSFYNHHPSADSGDNGYIISENSSTTIGDPGIPWDSVCFIESEKLIWTHGEFFCQKDDKGNAKIFYGTCSSDPDYINKAVVCPEFTNEDLVQGVLIFVTFTTTNNVDVEDVKLNVNNTGSKLIREQKIESSGLGYLRGKTVLRANWTHLFSYDGTYWILLTGDSDNNTTYYSMTTTEITAGTGTSARLITPANLKTAINTWESQSDWNEDNSSSKSYILNKPTIPSITGLATETYVNNKVADIVNSAPETLDTLNELAAALGNDPNFATTTATEIGTKVSKTELAGLGYVTQATLSAQSYLTSETQSNWTESNSSSAAYIKNKPTIPSVEGLVSQTTLSNQSYVTSTALNTRLNNAGYISSIPSEYVTQNELSANGYLTSQTKANWNETNANSAAYIQNKPTIPAEANNTIINIQKGGTPVDSFTTNASTTKTINIPNELPTYTSADANKILSVNSSGQLVWITPVSIYTGSGEPTNSIGNNGDIYVQA